MQANLSSGNYVKTKEPLAPRVCIKCGRTYQPRREDQKCCKIECRSRLQHPPEAAHSIIHGLLLEGGWWAFTVRYGCYAIRGFLFHQQSGALIWPKDRAGKLVIRGYGPFWKEAGGGLGVASKILQRLMRAWIKKNANASVATVENEPEESVVAQPVTPQRKIVCAMVSPCCHQPCERIFYVRYKEGKPENNSEEALLKWCRTAAWLERPALEGEPDTIYKWRCACGTIYEQRDSTLEWKEVDPSNESENR